MRQKVYYKMRHLFHYKMQQFYHKMRCFLQNALIHADIFANFIFQHLTYQLNKAGVTPVFEKGNKNYKTNYRLVSTLPSLSKIYERLIYNQINQTLIKIPYDYVCMVFAKNIALRML